MPRSMTGYGRAKKTYGNREITVELRAVNHRFFEFSAKYPRQYAFIEDKLKTLYAKEINRGKVESYITIVTTDSSDVSVNVNTELARNYIEALRAAGNELSLKDDLTLSQLFRIPDLFSATKQETDEDEIWQEVSETATEALAGFVAMREAEGERLKVDILTKLDLIESMVCEIEKRSPTVTEEYQKRLYARLQDVLEGKNIDDSRILTETAIFADKTAVDEETVRLHSHIAAFRELLEQNEPIGKKLDFLVQEINREINTTGSKCSDLTITKIVVELKSMVEKIREQIQNIE
ncbi:MAG: YicC family protein [Ruminococcus sp.]|nr:YicC family protein [Ruminococcus sp.]